MADATYEMAIGCEMRREWVRAIEMYERAADAFRAEGAGYMAEYCMERVGLISDGIGRR